MRLSSGRARPYGRGWRCRAEVDDVAHGERSAGAVGRLDHQPAVGGDVDGRALDVVRAEVDAHAAAERHGVPPPVLDQGRGPRARPGAVAAGAIDQRPVAAVEPAEEARQEVGPVDGGPEQVQGRRHLGELGRHLRPPDVHAHADDDHRPVAGARRPVAGRDVAPGRPVGLGQDARQLALAGRACRPPGRSATSAPARRPPRPRPPRPAPARRPSSPPRPRRPAGGAGPTPAATRPAAPPTSGRAGRGPRSGGRPPPRPPRARRHGPAP